MICGAKLRLRDVFCAKSPMGNGRCALHGGKTPKGRMSASYKTGKHSKYKYLVDVDAEEVEKLRELGPRLYDLEEETSNLVVMYRNALQRAKIGQSPKAWERLKELRQELYDWKAGKDDAEGRNFYEILDEMSAIIDRGSMAMSSLDQAAKFMDLKGKLVRDERKHWEASHKAVTREHFLLMFNAFFTGILNTTKKHIEDEDKLRAILGDFQTEAHKILGVE